MDCADPIRTLSVVIPAYNEEESLGELLERTTKACRSLNLDYEIIVVDDGSADRTAEILDAAAQAPDSRIVAVLLNRNYGQHAAVMAGFSQAAGDLIITMDADLQNPPEEIPRLVETAGQGYDVVGSVRVDRRDTWFRKFASRLINALIKRYTGKETGDYGCMLRAYRRHIVDAMLSCREHSTFIPILANSFAGRAVEIKVRHDERKFGDSKYGILKLINLMFDLVTCLTTTPLRLLSMFGLCVACSGFFLAFILVLLRLLLGPEWAAEGVFMLFAILFIFVGAQFIGLGLLGEYTGRVYTDVRARPRWLVRKKTGTPLSGRPFPETPDIGGKQ
ncbi:MAG: undecaprenyl-phosphate 4-deoxy-4-formamido-L-arabinose transferase [Desulfovibrio sp.]|jgi:undecaprenyl-phosphate 4-deoxy-4-formamido-L-arabinose transferase|nr:undecaprenyl-phosphate 4-deoxy-4-formamido-L-arabinose transferase [Desulfovibrio sp.]